MGNQVLRLSGARTRPLSGVWFSSRKTFYSSEGQSDGRCPMRRGANKVLASVATHPARLRDRMCSSHRLSGRSSDTPERPCRMPVRHVRLATLIPAFASMVFASSTFAQYDVTWHTADNGGVMFATGQGYKVGGSIGQSDAGTMSGNGNVVRGGFWVTAVPPAAGPPSPEPGGRYCEPGVKF